MTNGIPPALVHESNRAVLAHLADKSAHDDIAGVLMKAVKPLGDVQLSCPDWQAYRFVVASTNNVIFALAEGMQIVAFRLHDDMRSRALATGGVAYPAAGPGWVSFQPFRPDGPRVDLEFWARKAYGFAREDG
jgi:hypothetical protein